VEDIQAIATPSVATVVAPHCTLNDTVPEVVGFQVRVVVLPAVNSAPEAGALNALSSVVEVCAADSEKVARRPNARVKKRILFLFFVFLADNYLSRLIEGRSRNDWVSSLYVCSKEWHEPTRL
jgi:hypothetical protein